MAKIKQIRFIHPVNLSDSAQTPHMRLEPQHVKEMTFNNHFVTIIDKKGETNLVPMANISGMILFPEVEDKKK